MSNARNLANVTSPQLGGDLDLNSNDITGTGNAQIDGTVSVNTTSAPNQGSFQVNSFDASYANSPFDKIQASVVADGTNYNATQFFSDGLAWDGTNTGPNSDYHWGLTFARVGNNRRAGVSYDVVGREQFNIWSSYGYIQFLIRNDPAGDDEPYGANMIEALRIANDGLVHPQKGLKPTFESAWLSIGTGENRFVAHGLGRQPYIVRIYVKWDNVNDNKPWMCVGDLGVWGNSGLDFGVLGAVDNTYVALAVGESGISSDFGVSQSGFPTDNNAMANYLSTHGNGSGADFMDTPTETAGTWSSAYYKVFAW